MAVVAAARKLTVIIWHMLTEGRPYRLAPERTTREKLSLMHYYATGNRTSSPSRAPMQACTVSPLDASGHGAG